MSETSAEDTGVEMAEVVNLKPVYDVDVPVCLLCYQPIREVTKTPDECAKAVLVVISKILKVTGSIYSSADLNLLKGQLHCFKCGLNISEGLGILKEMEVLENKLDNIRTIIKDTLLSSFSEVNVDLPKLSPDKKVIHQIRKTFAQCWTDCQVKVRLGHQDRITNPSMTHPQRPARSRRGRKPQFEKVKIEMKRARKKKKKPAKNSTVNPRPAGQQQLHVQENSTVEETTVAPESVSEEDHAFERIVTDVEFSMEDDPVFPETDDTDADGGNADNTVISVEPFVSAAVPGIMRYSKSQQCGQKFPFTCELCGKGYQQKHFLDTHMDSHYGNWSYMCIVCDKKFSCARHLKLHEVNAHRLPTTNSRKIRRAVIGPQRNPRKAMLHSFTCSFCSKEYVRKDYIAEDGTFKIKCDLADCNKEFFLFALFRSHHEKTCPMRPPELFSCELCGKNYTSEKTLEQHKIISHTKNYEYYCEVCGQGVVSQGALNRHMLAHTDEKKHECDICHKRFKRKMQLTYHMRNHTRESLLMCGICGKTCNNPQGLRNHEYTHGQEKKFPCEICGKLFKTVNYVYNHIWATHKKGRQPRSARISRSSRKPKKEEAESKDMQEADADAFQE